MSDNIKNQALEILKKKLNKENFDNADYTKNLVQDLGLDSLDTVEMIMELESNFDITIPDDDAKKLQTIDDILKYLEVKTAK